jgi:hypothetical protein
MAARTDVHAFPIFGDCSASVRTTEYASMRAMRRGLMMAGFLGLVLLPAAAAAVSPDAPPMPMAIAHPVTAVSSPLRPSVPSRRLSEAGLLVLVGAGLLALGSVVRKATSVS